MNQLGMIPVELRALRQFVVWKLIMREGDEKPAKPLYNPTTLTFARTHDAAGREYPDTASSTWGTYGDAVSACRRDKSAAGIGFVFTENDPYVGIDLDGCLVNGKFTPEAADIVKRLNSYTERSQSGRGVHIIVRGVLPPGGRRKGSVEMYDRGRYFALTGNVLPKCSAIIEDRQAELNELHHLIFGEKPIYQTVQSRPTSAQFDVIARARAAKNGCKFEALYQYGDVSQYDGDESRADLALCAMLAFFTGANPVEIDHLFRSSALYRPKWERDDYRRMTIDKALSGKTEYYSPPVDVSAYKPVTRRVNTDTGEIEADPIYRHTEAGSADRVLAAHGEDIRHAYQSNRWWSWAGNRWTSDAQNRVLQLIESEMRIAVEQALQHPDEDTRKNALKHAVKTESSRYYQSIREILRHRPQVAVKPDDFDADEFLLNCMNGTLDLRTGELGAFRKEDMLSKLSGTVCLPEASAPVWTAFLNRVLPDPDVRAFFQRACGYALTGSTAEQCFFFLYGDGSNGKSTAITTLLSVLGEYAATAAPNLLIADRNGSKTHEMADISGKRFIATIEVDQGKKLAEGIVKSLTGGDKLKGRKLYQDFFEFTPRHKIFMAANHKPVIGGTDHAIWRRIMLIPFTETITDEEKDYRLKSKLEAEMPGILNWLVAGCREWQESGLRPPESVLAATQEYRAEQDTFGRFLADCFEPDVFGAVSNAAVNECYATWCRNNREVPMTAVTIGREFAARGYATIRAKNGRTITGLSLSSESKSMLEPRSGMFSN